MNGTNINNTFYSEYFDENIKNIYLLDKIEASKLWTLYIDNNATTFLD